MSVLGNCTQNTSLGTGNSENPKNCVINRGRNNFYLKKCFKE